MKISIRSKLTVAFLAFGAMLTLVLGWATYQSGKNSLYAATVSDLESTATEKQNALNSWVEDQRETLVSLGNTATLPEPFAALASTPVDAPGAQELRARFTAAFTNWAGSEKNFVAFAAIDANSGQILASTDPTDVGKYREDRAYFLNGKTRPYVQNIYSSQVDLRPAMTMATPIRDARGQLVGVLTGNVNLDKLNAIINRRHAGRDTDEAFLVNPSNLYVTQPRLISSSAVLQRGNYTEYVKQCLSGKSGTTAATDYRLVPVIAVYRWIPERELCLVVKIDQSEVFAPSDALGRTILGFGALIMLAGFGLAFALSRQITQPLLEMQRGAIRFGRGELSVRLSEMRRDELGELAGEFNRMAASLTEKETLLRGVIAQLQAANKELEAFSYSVSHDLRAPLRAIDGFSRILQEDYTSQLDADAQRYVQLVRRNTLQMGNLVDDLLTFSRLSRQPLNKQTLASGRLVQVALQDLRAEQEGRQIEFVIGDLPNCEGDPGLLKQVWVNLLTNALKFTRTRALAQIEIGFKKINGEGTYFVKDNGVGFDMQYVGKLFGVFQRLHRAEDFEGTGVGLAIVQRVIHRHGGRVWAEAELDHGATFYFTL